VEDIKLQQALAAIQDLDSEDEQDDEFRCCQTHEWVWPIALWSLASTAKKTPGMITLLLMPIIIETIVRGSPLQAIVLAVLYPLLGMMADGEYSALI
jgi:hypothetical protein